MFEPQSNGESTQEAAPADPEVVTVTSEHTRPASTGDALPESGTSRAEAALDNLLERASGWTQRISLQGLIWYSRAREELEDIVAEAQEIRHRKIRPSLSPFSPGAMYTRGREEISRIVLEAQQIKPGTRSPTPDQDPGPNSGPVVDVAPGIGPVADRMVDTVPGIGLVFSARLEEGGIRTVQDLAQAQPAELGQLLGTGEERAAAFIDEARKLLDQP